ncbi:hypothetical protein [Nonomuraea sp. NPDC050643]|uniref:hypothetical protein n=1 Tax=Nonomuraea sp. NPDC050643 TaxID=3155660 RepID=UPI003404E807
MPLATDTELERSTVVANRLMNRERRLRAYDRELGIDILGLLRASGTRPLRWLDLCCGAAYALGEAAHHLGSDAEITASVTTWRPDLVRFAAHAATAVLLLTGVAQLARGARGSPAVLRPLGSKCRGARHPVVFGLLGWRARDSSPRRPWRVGSGRSGLIGLPCPVCWVRA